MQEYSIVKLIIILVIYRSLDSKLVFKEDYSMKFKSFIFIIFFTFINIAHAASREEIDARVQETIDNFYKFSSAGKKLAEKSSGMHVIK